MCACGLVFNQFMGIIGRSTRANGPIAGAEVGAYQVVLVELLGKTWVGDYQGMGAA